MRLTLINTTIYKSASDGGFFRRPFIFYIRVNKYIWFLIGFAFSWTGKQRNIQSVFVLVSHNAFSSGPISLAKAIVPSKQVMGNY